MEAIYRSEAGARLIEAQYRDFLARWPTCSHLRVRTREGETFIIASGDPGAPPLVLLHGSMSNAAIWMNDATVFSRHFRVLAVLCPAGIGHQRRSFHLKALALMLLGPWGKTRLRKMVFGGEMQPSRSREFESYLRFKPRIVRFDAFTDTQLRVLTMPVLAIVGEKDVFFDSAETKRRLEDNVPDAQVIWLKDTGHMITNQTEAIAGFCLS